MPKYHVIIEDVQGYEFTIELPEGLTEEERNERLIDYLCENRDTCWRDGEEMIVAIDQI